MNELKEELLDRIYHDVKHYCDGRPMINFNVFTDNIKHRNRKYGIYCFFDVYEKIEKRFIQISLEYDWSFCEGAFFKLKDGDILEDVCEAVKPLLDDKLQKQYNDCEIIDE